MEVDVEAYLRRRYESQIADIEIKEKEDLDLVSNLCFSISASLLSDTGQATSFFVLYKYCFLLPKTILEFIFVDR